MIAPATEGASSVAPPKVGPLAPGQRWSVARKREVLLRLLRGESVELLSRELAIPVFKLEQWRQKADAALDGGEMLQKRGKLRLLGGIDGHRGHPGGSEAGAAWMPPEPERSGRMSRPRDAVPRRLRGEELQTASRA